MTHQLRADRTGLGPVILPDWAALQALKKP